MFHKTLVVLSLALPMLAGQPLAAKTRWPLWESYAAAFLDDSGRIVDHDAHDRTTSEGQAYALFFSLVANDRPRFERILSWTQTNLALGDLTAQLPSWLWEESHGHWGVTDENSASDADLWIAYTLLEAGRHWRDRSLTVRGRALVNLINRKEVVEIDGLGPVLLPGPTGFKTSDHWFQLNASYLPVQVFLGIANHTGDNRWREMAGVIPTVIEGSSAKGFILDWVAYRPGAGFSAQPSPVATPLASYDAIRVYLWAGMLATSTPGRERILAALSTMAAYLDQNSAPPATVSESGHVQDANGSAGFSAAVLPLLSVFGKTKPLAQQMRRIRAEQNDKTGLLGQTPHYFDQNLALFALGWSEKRFYFDEQGRLGVNWK
jgi:endo-1,4-beta-D-glucanase Y